MVFDGSAGAQTNYSRNTNLGADAGLDPTLILTNTTLVTRSMQLGNNATCTGTVIMNSNSLMTVAANNFAVGYSTGTQSAGILTCRIPAARWIRPLNCGSGARQHQARHLQHEWRHGNLPQLGGHRPQRRHGNVQHDGRNCDEDDG